MQRISRALQRVQALPRNTLKGASIAAARGFSSDIKRDGESITVEVNEYKTHRMESPSTTVTATKEELLSFFEMMYRMRRMEVSADVLYKAKQIRGFCHLYDGQEAVIVGMEAAMTREDSIITSYRDHATHLARGGTVAEVMGEVMGKRTGCSLGKGGSMHMYRREANFFGGQGIVGAQVPLGAGMALAHSYMKNDAIAVTIYGDGAANQGQIFESMNMAALWDLPCVFVCENNHYGMGTAEWRGAKSSAFYTRGDYIPGLRIDGMDVLAVKQGMAHARAHALQHGPVVLEMDTYRYHGHSMSDPGSTYRTRDEVAGIRKTRDPIEHVRRLLTESGLAEAQELRALEQAVKKEVDAAVAESKAAANPESHNLWEHVYVDGLDAQLRGVHRDSWFTAPRAR